MADGGQLGRVTEEEDMFVSKTLGASGPFFDFVTNFLYFVQHVSCEHSTFINDNKVSVHCSCASAFDVQSIMDYKLWSSAKEWWTVVPLTRWAATPISAMIMTCMFSS